MPCNGQRYPLHLNRIAKQLNRKYDCFCHHNKKNPLNELVFILCSVKRREVVYLRAFKSLKQSFPTYKLLHQASIADLTNKIDWGGLQNQKAKALKNLLTAINTQFGGPTLAPLRNMAEAECERFLCSLPGIGKKVARCVMLFSLNLNVFPVDTHCWRISQRLGWIKTKGKSRICFL